MEVTHCLPVCLSGSYKDTGLFSLPNLIHLIKLDTQSIVLSTQTGDASIFRNLPYQPPQFNIDFSSLHGMPARTSDEKGVGLSVRPSVCPSVRGVNCDNRK